MKGKEVVRAWAILLPQTKMVSDLYGIFGMRLPIFTTFKAARDYRRAWTITLKGARIRRVRIVTEE